MISHLQLTSNLLLIHLVTQGSISLWDSILRLFMYPLWFACVLWFELKHVSQNGESQVTNYSSFCVKHRFRPRLMIRFVTYDRISKHKSQTKNRNISHKRNYNSLRITRNLLRLVSWTSILPEVYDRSVSYNFPNPSFSFAGTKYT
jgi:hypothetical protein